MESHDIRVVEVLEDMKSELEYINSAMAGKDKLSPFEKNKLELKFNSIKEKLDVAKRFGNVDLVKREPFDYEKRYFQSAVRNALIEIKGKFCITVSKNTIRISNAISEIDYELNRIEREPSNRIGG